MIDIALSNYSIIWAIYSQFEIFKVESVSNHIPACSDETNWVSTRNSADVQANNKKYLCLHNAPASVIRFKQNICDNVPATAVFAIFIRKPELVCYARSENALNNGVAVEKSAATVVGILTVKSLLVPAKIVYFL